jgi:uncharacterized glyoxalase superfamily protein PhnB
VAHVELWWMAWSFVRCGHSDALVLVKMNEGYLMRKNRSIPNCTVIPELAYANVTEAADWLCRSFGFTVRVRIADHRVQLNAGAGALVVTELRGKGGDTAHGIMVRVEDADAHHTRALECGVEILHPPTDYPYGERQYTAVDLGGHVWKFTQTIADVEPESWGGVSGQL